MEKEDLKNGMVVEIRDGRKYIVIENKLIGINSWLGLNDYFDNLYCKGDDFRPLDIMKVLNIKIGFTLNDLLYDTYSELIWERKEDKPQLTERERAYLKAYIYDYEWIARDIGKTLFVFKNRPHKLKTIDCWVDDGLEYDWLKDDDMFDFIKWEDEEPYNIKKLLGEE